MDRFFNMKLLLTLLFAFAGTTYGLSNLSRGKKATQSSTGWDGVASRAVDGNTNGDYYKGLTCAHTKHAEGQTSWWKVDLASMSEVKSVVIHNRKDCCSETLSNAQIFVGVDNNKDGELCGKVGDAKGKLRIEIVCHKPLKGQFVTVKVANYLMLCEVEVMGGPYLENLALGKSAVQSGLYKDAVAGRATDGNINNDYFKKSCSHTNYNEGQMSWWRVDLGKRSEIHKVILFNRMDCCSERLSHAIVFVGETKVEAGQLCGNIGDSNGKEKFEVSCKKPLNGRYVTVMAKNFLTLCEVKVMGVPAPKQAVIG